MPRYQQQSRSLLANPLAWGGFIVLVIAGVLVWWYTNSRPKPSSPATDPTKEPTPPPQEMWPVNPSGTIPFSTPVEFPVAQKPIVGLEFSPDGRWLAALSADRSVYLFDTTNPKPRELQRGHPVTAVGLNEQNLAFSADGALLVWCGAGELKTYDLAAQKVIAKATPPFPNLRCRFVGNSSTLLVVANIGGQMRLTWYDARTGRETRNEILATHPYAAAETPSLSEDGSLIASVMMRPDTSPKPIAPIVNVIEMQVLNVPAQPSTKPQEMVPRWGGKVNKMEFYPRAIASNNRYALSTGFDEVRQKETVYLHNIASGTAWHALSDYDAGYGFSPDGAAMILGVSGKDPVKHRHGNYRVKKWFWAEFGKQPRLGNLPDLKQTGSNLPLAYEAIAFSKDQKKAAYGDVNGSVWLGGVNTNHLQKKSDLLVDLGNPSQDPGTVEPKTEPKTEPKDPVVVKPVEPKTTTSVSDLQIGDWAEYRFLKNGSPEWTRKLTVVGIDGNTAKVRYETILKSKPIPANDIPHPLDKPFKEKGHTLPEPGVQGKRTITLLSEKTIQVRFGESLLDCRALHFRESTPLTLDGQGELRTEETFWLSKSVPFGGLVRSRNDSLIINGKAGLMTVLELVRFSRGGKIFTGPLDDSTEPIVKEKKKDPVNIGNPDDREALRRRINDLIRQNDFLKAIQELQAILQKYPTDVGFWRLLAYAGYRIGDWKEVDRATTKLEEMGQISDTEWFFRGTALIYLSNRDAEALKVFEKYHALKPDDPEAWVPIAQLRLLLNNLKGHREMLDFAFKRQPAVQAINRRAAYLTARIAGSAPLPAADFKRSLALAALGMEMEQNGAWTINTHAMIQLRTGNAAAALDGFARSLKQDPRWAGAPLNGAGVALGLLQQGKKDDAMKLLVALRERSAKGIPGLHIHDLLALRLMQRELESRLGK